ncbi:unnamed protein product, partial [Effrenium voratum]
MDAAGALRRSFARGRLSGSRGARGGRSASSVAPFWPTELDASISDGSILGAKSGSLGSLGSGSRPLGLRAGHVALGGELAEFAGRQPTALRLTEILAMKTQEGLRSILQEELPVRLANRIAHLDNLPDLEAVRDIRSVRQDFAAAFEEVRTATPENFAGVIRRFKKRNEDHALRLTQGMKAWGELQRGKGQPEETRAFIDSFLDRLFLSRIGMETLTSQYLALSTCPDGIVDLSCDPCQVCASAAKQVSDVASEYLVTVPKIEISFHGDQSARTLPLIPHYLFYIVAELLKNSLRAVGELHESGSGNLEPVQIRVASDESQ